MGDEETATPSEVIRLAIVMNGGVSLAVWMGGVTHELDRLLERTANAESSDAWHAILAARRQDSSATDTGVRKRRVVVDYVAGTSAGGLNGALLATAIARHAPLPRLKDLWKNSARLTVDALLPTPDEAGSSLLDGTFFESEIEAALASAVPAPDDSDHGDDSAVTLLVTSTALTASPLNVVDANKHEFKVSDRRRVYRFESAARSVEGIDSFSSRVLARAARASAGFPGAFEPVEESPGLAERRIDPWAARARARRRADRRAGRTTHPTWLIDGGVLDNAPFEPLLEEIRQHPRADEGERWVVYVVPSSPGLPGSRATHETDLSDPSEPPIWSGVLTKLWGIKGEVDLRSDIEALKRLQSHARSTHQSPEILIASPPLLSMQAVEKLLPAYQRTRAEGFVQFLRETGATSEKLKRIDVAEESITRLVTAPASFVPVDLRPRRDGRWQWGTTVARRLTLWMSRDARNRHVDHATVRLLADAEKQVERLHRRMTSLYTDDLGAARREPMDTVRKRHTEVETILDELWPPLSGAVECWAATLLHPTPGSTPGTALTPAAGWRRLLTTEVLLNFAQWNAQASPPDFDVVLVDTGAPQLPDLLARDHPDLRSDLATRPDDKLYGTALGHFGAFGHERYRAHDWAWGRIDAALCLGSALLAGVGESERRGLREALVNEILVDEGIVEEGSASLEKLRMDTRDAFAVTNASLLVDIIKGGEVEVDNTVEAIERAVTELSSTSRLHPLLVELVDSTGDVLKAGDKVARAARRLRDAVSSAAGQARDLFARIWPGG